ncbi:MAG: FlgD immunoglobulin-like domain containing protein [Calditrichia bacterium]
MKHIKSLLFAIVFGCLATSTIFAQGLTFTFANGQLTGTGPYKYRVFVFINADTPGTKLGDTQVYINYNSLAFGDSIAARGKLSSGRTTLLGGNSGGTELYSIQNIVDHGTNRVCITAAYDFESNTSLANEVPETPTGLFFIDIEVENRAWLSGLSFEGSLMQGQQFLADNFLQYSSVIATDTDDTVLGVETVQNNIIPSEFKMDQNYPNPFNPETTVRFDLPASLGGENVTLVVYDMLGRKVRTLQDGPLSAGTYELKWDAKTDTGADLASGTYLLRLQAKRQQQIIKMLLMK